MFLQTPRQNSTHERRSLFVTEKILDLVLIEILECSTVHKFAISAYVFMPDHVHLLAEGCADACDLKAFVHTAKQKSAYVTTNRAFPEL